MEVVSRQKKQLVVVADAFRLIESTFRDPPNLSVVLVVLSSTNLETLERLSL